MVTTKAESILGVSINERVPLKNEQADYKSINKLEYLSTTSSFDNRTSTSGYAPELEWTEEEEKRVLFKIDTKLMPFILLMTFVLNMDRTNISNAISDNLPEELGFGITGVNIATLVHSITFTAVTLITNPVAKRVGPHLWIPFLMFSWAVVTWAHVFLQDYKGFLCIRFFIAFTEAGFIPSCLLYFTTWYKSSELATRLAWFWGIQAFASAFSGLISFGVFKLEGVAGLYGWKWLFLIDGVFTHIVGFIAIFYLPGGPTFTKGFLRGKYGWFTEREVVIAVTRIMEDDKSKLEQGSHITLHDAKIAISDIRLWAHLLIAFTSIMPDTPVKTYFPRLIKGYGFSVTTSNILTVPANLINLSVSIFIANRADKKGNYALYALIGCMWSMIGFLSLIHMPNSAGRWNLYAATLFTASTPSFHGMHIAWMSANVAPHSKRILALGAVIGAANICGVPGSQIYQESDSPRFIRGNWINFGLMSFSAILLLIQHVRYVSTNRYRQKKWNSLTELQKERYIQTTKDEGSDRLDFMFRI